MIKRLFSLLPVNLQDSIRDIKKKIFPPRITIDRFYKGGVVFEVPTDMEYYRAISLGEEEEFMELVLSSLSANDVFYDIGSCIGLYAIHALKQGASVVAFEPDPSYRKRLLRNIKLNKVSGGVKVVDWAVSNINGNVKLYTDGTKGVSPSLVQVGKRGSVIVKSNTIDNAINTGELPIPTVIKMDIEGAETLALQGMKDLLTSSAAPRMIFLEIHPVFLRNFGASVEDCIDLLKSMGYQGTHNITRHDQIQAIYHR
jgi:FkbM family methyltransferase